MKQKLKTKTSNIRKSSTSLYLLREGSPKAWNYSTAERICETDEFSACSGKLEESWVERVKKEYVMVRQASYKIRGIKRIVITFTGRPVH